MFFRLLLVLLSLLSGLIADVALATPVGNTPPDIKFVGTPDQPVYGGTYNVVVTALPTSGVVISIDSSATSVCSISGTTVSFIGVGTCAINASFAGDSTYKSGSKQQTFTVAAAPPAIQFSGGAPNNAKVGGTTYTVAATSLSDKPVTFAIDSSATSYCAIGDGNVVSFIGAGTCVINASVEASSSGFYKAGTKVRSFDVGKGDQTVSFSTTAPSDAQAGGSTYPVTASATSGLTVALTIDASASGICSISGGEVSFIADGTCVIDANQSGNANYNAASQAQQSFSVAPLPVHRLAVSAPESAVAGTSFNVTVTAKDRDDHTVIGYSGTIAITSDDAAAVLPANAALANGVGTFTVTLKTVGTQSVRASDANDSGTTGAAGVAVSAGSPASVTAYNGTPQSVDATSGSFDPLVVEVRDASGNLISGASVTFSAPASGASGLFDNEETSQAIETDENGLASAAFVPNGTAGSYIVTAKIGELTAEFELENTGTAAQVTTGPQPVSVKVGEPVSFTAAASGNPTPTVQWQVSTDAGQHFTDIADATATTLSFTALISQSGNQYRAVFSNGGDPATTDPATLTVSKLGQTIAFSTDAPTDAVVGGSYAPSVSNGGSSASVMLSIDPSATDYCSISDGTVSFTGVGTCTILANQAGDETHDAAAEASQFFSIAAKQLHFEITMPASATAGTAISEVKVRVLDANNDVATDYTGSVTFTSTDGAANLPADYPFGGVDSGVHTFMVTLNTPGSQTITVTDTVDSGLTATSDAIEVSQNLPVVTSLSPSSGVPQGGTEVTIGGSNFTGATAVRFGGIDALDFTVNGDSSITATSPAGSGDVDVTVTTPGGTSQASGGDLFSYSEVPEDSRKAEAVQTEFAPTVATKTLRVVGDVVVDAVAQGFADVLSSDVDLDGVFMGYTATPDRPTPFDGVLVDPHAKLPPNVSLWMDTTGGGVLSSGDTSQKGWQVNVTGGVGLRVNSSLVVGGLAGFERFAYKDSDLDGTLSGSGTSLGGYLGWKITDRLLATLGVVHTDLSYDVRSGDASGSFGASRWLVTGALSGEFALADFTVRPSARISGIWERDGDYIDSLDTAHDSATFGSATASAGIVVSRALPITEDWQLVPHLGAYLDARTKSTVGGDDEPGSATGRVSIGADVKTGNGAALGIDGQLGGIGGDTLNWSAKGSIRADF